MHEIEVDNYDYMKWFFINIIKVPENEFPNVMEYINEDNEEDYDRFMDGVEYYLRRTLGISLLIVSMSKFASSSLLNCLAKRLAKCKFFDSLDIYLKYLN